MNTPAKYLLSYDFAECLLIGKHVVVMLFSEICFFQILRLDLPLDDSSCCLLILSCRNMLLVQFNNLLENSNISIIRTHSQNLQREERGGNKGTGSSFSCYSANSERISYLLNYSGFIETKKKRVWADVVNNDFFSGTFSFLESCQVFMKVFLLLIN